MAHPEAGGEIGWYGPDPRAILPLDGFHASRSLLKKFRQRVFEITADRAFTEVMRECAKPSPGREETWISEAFIESYTRLHEVDHAHSVEAWRDGELVGGIYGVSINAAFFAESMFVRPEQGGTDASKICLFCLVNHLISRGYSLLDVQFITPHSQQFGCIEIPRSEYLARLHAAIMQGDVNWGDFSTGRSP